MFDNSVKSTIDEVKHFLHTVHSDFEQFQIRHKKDHNDINLKSQKPDIILLSNEWDKLKQIEIVNFKYNDSLDENSLYGAIAQQVQEVYPNLVVVTREATEIEPEYYGLREQPFQWLTTKVLQEAMTRIETLEARVQELENK
jgi:hypothetical protein